MCFYSFFKGAFSDYFPLNQPICEVMNLEIEKRVHYIIVIYDISVRWVYYHIIVIWSKNINSLIFENLQFFTIF